MPPQKNQNKQINRKPSSWILYLFALPFAGVAVGFLFVSILPSLWQWTAMQQWQPVPAQIIQAQLNSHRGDGSSTWEATARYQYQFDGEDFVGTRVGIMAGADNIGSWQKDRAAVLKSAHRNNKPVTAWVNPEAPQQAVLFTDMRWGMIGFKLIFVVVFGLIGFGLMIYTHRARDKKSLTEGAQDIEAEPWLLQKQWANPIASGTKLGLWLIWGFTIIWNAITAPILFQLPQELSRDNMQVVIALLFPLIGAGLLILAVIKTAQWRRFGQTLLQLNPYPGSIGGQVGGTLDLKLAYSQDLLVSVSLSCIRSYTTGSGKNRSKRESVRWQSCGYAQNSPLSNGTRLAFCFDVPENLPASEPADDDYYFWRVSLSAALPGADLDQQFLIPVFATAQSSRGSLPKAIAHPQAEVAREQALERLLNVEQLPGGIALHYPMFRNLASNGIGAFIGWLFFAIGVYLWSTEAPRFMAVIFSLLGGGIGLAATYGLLNRYEVKIGERGIFTQRYLFGVRVGKKFYSPESVSHLAIKANGSTQMGAKHIEHFVINAHLNDGEKVKVVESINGRELAQQALESVALLSGYSASAGGK